MEAQAHRAAHAPPRHAASLHRSMSHKPSSAPGRAAGPSARQAKHPCTAAAHVRTKSHVCGRGCCCMEGPLPCSLGLASVDGQNLGVEVQPRPGSCSPPHGTGQPRTHARDWWHIRIQATPKYGCKAARCVRACVLGGGGGGGATKGPECRKLTAMWRMRTPSSLRDSAKAPTASSRLHHPPSHTP